MTTRTWIHPITKEHEVVEINSPRDKELTLKLNECGLWDENDPNKPEGCMTSEEFISFLEKEKLKTSEQRYQEYLNRKNNTNEEIS